MPRKQLIKKEKPPKKPAGRPPHQPTPETRNSVGVMAAVGLYKYECAKILGIDHDTFTKYYDDDYEIGLAKAIVSVGTKVLKQAQSDRPTAFAAQQLFLKTRGRWTEQRNVEISGPNGGAVPIRVDIDALDYEELRAIDEMLSPLLIEGKVIDTEDDDADGAD